MDVQEAKVEEEKQPATWEESSTMAFPPGLPMEHTYLKSEFYVRDCYSDYYQYVLRLLKVPHTEVVTVTGTSGKTSFVLSMFVARNGSNSATWP
jgi:UDP-N-acetylmuramoylalanine-D-glutamate ligase